MALSPGIPTSFVPRQPSDQGRRAQKAGSNLFLLVALFVAGVAVVASLGTFAYDRYLTHVLNTRAEELALAQRAVNQDQVEEFVRLRDRLTFGKDLLGSHIALSQVFGVLEAQTLKTVGYGSLKLAVANDHTAQLEIEGTARSFNALAAQSNAFAAEKGIRRAIFSGIVVNKDNTVNFKLSADLDSRLLISGGTQAAAAGVGLTSPPPPAAATTTP